MIGLLARRTLGDRPRRTAMLLLGLGIAVGVMITLLSIGDAVLEQSRDKDIVGGGDLVLLPAGIDVEVMKVGGVTGMYFTLDNARYIFRQVLSGPRFASKVAAVTPDFADLPLAAASPALVDKVVYVRKAGVGAAGVEVDANTRRGATAGASPAGAAEPVQALAHGFIPSLDAAAGGPTARFASQGIEWKDSEADRHWADPPMDVLYNELDRFHLPASGQADIERWGEWLYFNFTDPVTDTFGYVSYIVGNDIAAGAGRAAPLLQIQSPGVPPRKFDTDMPVSQDDVSLSRVDLRFGAHTTAQFRDGSWQLRLGWETDAGPVRGTLTVTPVRDLYFPPVVIHESERFVSGYTVPAVRAHVSGVITAPGVQLELRDAPGYHDHNWGTWRNVHWDWGTSSTDEYALLYGRVLHAEIPSGQSGPALFLMLSRARTADARGGLLGLFRPTEITYEWQDSNGLPGDPTQLPTRITIVAECDGHPVGAVAASDPDRIHVVIDVTHVASTPPNEANDAASRLVFLQARGAYHVTARIAGNEVRFDAPGFSEVFVTSNPSAIQ